MISTKLALHKLNAQYQFTNRCTDEILLFSFLFLTFGTPLSRAQTGSPYLRVFDISEPQAVLGNPDFWASAYENGYQKVIMRGCFITSLV
jgi:hypothetical protein